MRQLVPAVLLLACVLLVTPARAQSLGSVDFPTSTQSADAQAAFERGLLLLHSFEYDDARDAFQEARQLDRGFAMASWGEAMTHNRPIWMQQDKDAALAALRAPVAERLGMLRVIAVSDRELAYLKTLDVLFGEGDKEDRDDAYEQAMADLAAAYPDDLDAQSLWALSILGTAHEGRDFAAYMRAAAILEEVFAANPEHPGAAHYLIHAYDDPVHAPLGLRPARVYADVAPDASHALHMPSHIYLSLGMWAETADLNRRSYEAARANSERRGEALNNHGWHALWWWHYAELQRGDTDEAMRLRDLAVELAGDTPSDLAAAHLTRIGAQHFVATGDIRFVDLPVQGTSASSTAAFYQALGMATATLRLGTRSIQDAAVQDELASEVGTVQASYRDAVDVGPDAPWEVRAVDLFLSSFRHAVGGEVEEAVGPAQAAAALEAEAPLTFGPPVPALGFNEWLGTVLLQAGRPDAAVEALEVALSRTPGRTLTLARLQAAQAETSREEFDGASSRRP